MGKGNLIVAKDNLYGIYQETTLQRTVYLSIIYNGSTFFFSFYRKIEEKTLGNGDVDLQKNSENSMYRLRILDTVILAVQVVMNNVTEFEFEEFVSVKIIIIVKIFLQPTSRFSF